MRNILNSNLKMLLVLGLSLVFGTSHAKDDPAWETTRDVLYLVTCVKTLEYNDTINQQYTGASTYGWWIEENGTKLVIVFGASPGREDMCGEIELADPTLRKPIEVMISTLLPAVKQIVEKQPKVVAVAEIPIKYYTAAMTQYKQPKALKGVFGKLSTNPLFNELNRTNKRAEEYAKRAQKKSGDSSGGAVKTGGGGGGGGGSGGAGAGSAGDDTDDADKDGADAGEGDGAGAGATISSGSGGGGSGGSGGGGFAGTSGGTNPGGNDPGGNDPPKCEHAIDISTGKCHDITPDICKAQGKPYVEKPTPHCGDADPDFCASIGKDFDPETKTCKEPTDSFCLAKGKVLDPKTGTCVDPTDKNCALIGKKLNPNPPPGCSDTTKDDCVARGQTYNEATKSCNVPTDDQCAAENKVRDKESGMCVDPSDNSCKGNGQQYVDGQCKDPDNDDYCQKNFGTKIDPTTGRCEDPDNPGTCPSGYAKDSRGQCVNCVVPVGSEDSAPEACKTPPSDDTCTPQSPNYNSETQSCDGGGDTPVTPDDPGGEPTIEPCKNPYDVGCGSADIDGFIGVLSGANAVAGTGGPSFAQFSKIFLQQLGPNPSYTYRHKTYGGTTENIKPWPYSWNSWHYKWTGYTGNDSCKQMYPGDMCEDTNNMWRSALSYYINPEADSSGIIEIDKFTGTYKDEVSKNEAAIQKTLKHIDDINEKIQTLSQTYLDNSAKISAYRTNHCAGISIEECNQKIESAMSAETDAMKSSLTAIEEERDGTNEDAIKLKCYKYFYTYNDTDRSSPHNECDRIVAAFHKCITGVTVSYRFGPWSWTYTRVPPKSVDQCESEALQEIKVATSKQIGERQNCAYYPSYYYRYSWARGWNWYGGC